MRDTLVEKIIEKQHSLKRLAGKAEDVRRTIERKHRIVEDHERKIQLTKEGISDKQAQLAELESTHNAHNEALVEMQGVLDLFDSREVRIQEAIARMKEISDPLEAALELNPRGPKPQDDPEYVVLMSEVLQLRSFNAQADADLRKIFYRKVLL